MIIEIRGVQFENKGAQLMLRAVLSQVKSRLPEAMVALRPNTGTTRADLLSVNALAKLPLRKRSIDLSGLSYVWPHMVDKALKIMGAVTEGSVDAVLDASGFAYGDRWGAGALRASADELTRFRRSGKPYVFLPQAFGPFDRTRTAATGWGVALESSPLVAVRDATSELALRRLIPDADNIHRYPDITIGLEVEREAFARSDVDRGTALLIPNVRALEKTDKKIYFSTFEEIVTRLRSGGYAIRVMNHGGYEDAALCRELSESVGGIALPVIDNPDPIALKALIGSAGFVVSSRFHACVAALSQGVPSIAIAWTHKYRELFSSFGCIENVIELENTGASVDLSKFNYSRTAPNQDLISAADRQRRALDGLWERVFARLKS